MLACASVAARADAPSERSDSLQDKIYSVFESSKGAVVKVLAQKNFVGKDKDGKETPLTTLDVGTGFLVGKEGVVMTSAYVTHGAYRIWVEWKGVLIDAKSLGFDPLTTLSVIKIAGDFKSKDPEIITIDSTASLPRVGTMLTSVSYEMGLPPSPRLGLATGHNIEFGGTFLPTIYVRTNIPAPRGSTGGAVFDMNGKFVGMTIASLPEIGGSFILPAKAVAKIRDDIMLCGEPVYSWFGLRAEDADGPEGTRIVVTLVAENAPAKKAGFILGDEIVEINSKRVSNNTELRDCTFFVRPGETAVFKIKRADKLIKLEVLAERMAPEIIRSAESSMSEQIIRKSSPPRTAPEEQKK